MEIKNNIKNELVEIFNKYDIQINDRQVEQFNLYYNFLIQENEKYNLTAITEPSDVILKHFMDCALGVDMIKNGATLCDIGTGAGFPAIPLKILLPELKVVLVDSLNKRVNFLNELIKILNLDDIVAYHERAEDFLLNYKFREKFDYVVSRAVAKLNTLLEITIPALKIGGKAIYYKSLNSNDEIMESENACKILGCQHIESVEKKLDENFRTLLVFEKKFATPIKYPRGKNLPKTKPL